jgi:tol-pal system protein YbgF
MNRIQPKRLPAWVWALGAVLACGAATGARAAPPAGPQQAVPPPDASELSGNRGIDHRLDRDEQTLRDLRQIVLQAKATGVPVTVKDAGPDPAIVDMQAKIDDFDQTLRRLNGQVEELQHNLDLTRKALSDATDANRDLTARVVKLEGLVQAMQAPPAPAAAGPAPGAGTGVLGQLPANAVPPSAVPPSADQSNAPGGADEILAYRQARQILDSGDYAGGAAALQDYLAHYPASPRASEANYWLGRTLALQNMHADAAAAYARALKGWPQSPWAGDAVVRLSASLLELKRADDACRALSEYDQRYAAKAATAVKVRAKDVRARAACG